MIDLSTRAEHRRKRTSCNVNIEFETVEWQVLLNAARATPDAPTLLKGALNVSRTYVMARYFSSGIFSSNGFNFEQWKDDEFDAALKTLAEATDEATMQSPYRKAHERLVDNPPWLYIVHDLNPRAMSKR
jgi:ABC-type transport system substrate-binding protein